MLEEESLFGEETEQQIFDLIKEVEDLRNGFGIVPEEMQNEERRLTDEIFSIRETVLISAVNKIDRFLEEIGKNFSCQVWQELKDLYLYGKGYHSTTKAEYEARNRAYKLFRARLAREGRLVENLDLVQDMP